MPSRFLVKISIAALLAAPGALLAQSGRSDAQIKADVESKLHSDEQLSQLAIGVNVQNGVVTLTGNAASEDQLTQAENDISSIQGITQIQDNLAVQSAPTNYNSAPSNAQNEAAAAAQNAQPPANANDDQQQYGDQGAPENGQPGMDNNGYNQPGPPPQPGYGNQPYNQPGPPNGYGDNVPPPPPNGNRQGGYGAGYNNQRPMHYDVGGNAVTLPAGTVISVRSLEQVVAGKNPVGSFVRGVIAHDIPGANGIILPRGAPVTMQIVSSKEAGHYKGGAVLTLKLANMQLGNASYPLASDVWGQQSYGNGGRTAGNTVGGAAFGALLGAIAGGGPGAAIGAAAGGATGAALSGANPRPQAYIPAEGIVTFRLTTPLTFTTVSPDQAKMLAASAPPLQPNRPPGPPRPYYRPYGPYYGPY